QLWSENAQEAYDNTLMAFRIAEHPDVLTPTIINLDGFIISHTAETVDVLDDDQVKDFVGTYTPERSLLDTDNPYSIGALFLTDNYFECRRQQAAAIEGSVPVIEAVSKEFGEMSGRSYDLLERYRMDDADAVIIAMGSTTGTAKVAVDDLRARGVKAGLLKIRLFRPFPGQLIVDNLKDAKVVGVMDRAISYGLNGGPLFHEVRSHAYGQLTAPLVSYVYGLGGRDIGVEQIEGIYGDLADTLANGTDTSQARYIGLREE
ncbi:pyruvate ferredoxin oxidoreductase, partial [bacterium]|nr:pyruvate ferredoxin oxidoreductase [bacterium]